MHDIACQAKDDGRCPRHCNNLDLIPIFFSTTVGGSLNTINGGLECPAASGGSVISRLDDYCKAAVELGTNSLLALDGCTGLDQRLVECLGANSCPNCVGIGSPSTSPTGSPTKAVSFLIRTSRIRHKLIRENPLT